MPYITIGIVVLVLLYLLQFWFQCHPKVRAGKSAVQPDLPRTDLTPREEMLPPIKKCCGEDMVMILINDQWEYWCKKCGNSQKVTLFPIMSMRICQLIVEDQLDYLVRIGLDFKPGEKDSVRDNLCRIVAGKLPRF